MAYPWTQGQILSHEDLNAAFDPFYKGQGYGTIAWSEYQASATIFRKGVIPPVLNTQATMTLNDKFKLLARFNFGEVWGTEQAYDAWSTLQNFLLWAQLMALTFKDLTFDNNCFRQCVEVYLPRGFYLVSQPLVIPEFVRLTGPGLICRAPYVGAQSGGTLVPGAFYGTSAAGSQTFLPTVVFAPRSHGGTIQVYTGNSNIAFRGSGIAVGTCWAALLGADATIGLPGSGYNVGDIVTGHSVSIAPYLPCAIQVTSINGSGGILAATVYKAGAYGLPPSLQPQQWTTSNGFPNVFDPLNPGYFLQGSVTNSSGGASSGSGCSFLPTWRSQFQSNNYDYGAAVQSDILIEHINVTGYMPGNFSSTYGYTFGVMVCGLNGVIGEIELLGGQAGVFFRYANDWRVGHLNVVLGIIGIAVYSSGSIELPNVVLDTCGCATTIDESGRVLMRGMVFMEEGNLGGGSTFVNTQGYPVKIGASSNNTFNNHHLDIDLTLVNMGGVSAALLSLYPHFGSTNTVNAALYLAYCYSSRIKLMVSNLNEAATGATLLPILAFVEFNAGVTDGSVVIEGEIDGITGPACTGNVSTAPCDVRVWDAVASGRAGPLGTYQMWGTVSPMNGTSGTGVGKAGTGSKYMNVSTGIEYRNTGSLSSPTWT